MASMRQNPGRSRRPARPAWLVPLVVAVGALALAGVVFAVVSLMRGGDEATTAPTDTETALPCVEVTVVPAEVLPRPQDVRVRVFNATAVSGLAGTTAKELSARDFQVVKVANDPKKLPVEGVAKIRYGPKGEASAQLLLVYVPGAELAPDERTGRIVDLALGDAFTSVEAQETVDAVLASPSPSASGPGCPSPAP
jgi:hypothetical protein